MNLKQLRYVQALADEGSFARAADTLGISQPSLSQYIKKIETQTGMQLFNRSGGDVRLTDAGRIYVDAGKKILDLEHQMQNQFLDIASNKFGSVVVGTSPYRSASMMPKIISEFQKCYPGIHVIVEEMTSAELLDATEHGRFDLCLTLMPAENQAYEWEKIAEEELILAVPSSFPKMKAQEIKGKKYPGIDAKQISGGRFVMITESQAMQRTFDRLCTEYDISVEKAAVVKSLEAQIAMVRAGIGMALVPTGIETFCTENEVEFYSFKQNINKREVVALWQKNRSLNLVTKKLLEIMKEISW